jgi:nucleotide-binding universal stress UspA family protein
MMIKKILAAYDGSESADKAYAYALDMAKKYQAELRVLSVARPPEPAEDVETEALLENAEEHYEKQFTLMKQRAVAEGVRAEFKVVAGHPAEQIIYQADDNGTDLVVMGHRGKGFFERLMLGSISKQVVHYANCAVLIVR